MKYSRLLSLLVFVGSLSAGTIPDWLSISGEVRARYETLDGQFRSGRTGGDQGLFLRSLLKLEAQKDGYVLGGELQDSRSYLTDSGSAISSSYINVYVNSVAHGYDY